MTIEQLVNSSLESGIRPIELRLCGIVNPQGDTIAYRSETKINSIVCGCLGPADYADAIDFSEAGEELFLRNIALAALVLSKKTNEGKRLEWISVRCPTVFLEDANAVSKLLSKLKSIGCESLKNRLCIELSDEIMTNVSEVIKSRIIDLKSVGLKVCISGGGKKSFAFMMLPSVRADYLIIEGYDSSRNDGSEVYGAIASLASSLGTKVIIESVRTEKDLYELCRRDIRYALVSGSELAKNFGANDLNLLAEEFVGAEVAKLYAE